MALNEHPAISDGNCHNSLTTRSNHVMHNVSRVRIDDIEAPALGVVDIAVVVVDFPRFGVFADELPPEQCPSIFIEGTYTVRACIGDNLAPNNRRFIILPALCRQI